MARIPMACKPKVFAAYLLLVTGFAISQPDPGEGPDRVVLRNGTVVKGRIVAADEASVTLVFEFGDES